jgi:hypothetical protein
MMTKKKIRFTKNIDTRNDKDNFQEEDYLKLRTKW